jgi:hypothetical protein
MTKRCAFAFVRLCLLLVGLLGVGTARELTDLAEVATGSGTLRFNDRESIGIKAVVVLLRNNGEAEIWLITGEENVYAGGRWFRGCLASRSVDFEITDDTSDGCATGGGTVFLQEGCVPVARLRMTMSRLDGVSFEADFISKNPRPCANPCVPGNGCKQTCCLV